MRTKYDFLAYILDKAFNEYNYRKIDRLQIEKLSYLVQAVFKDLGDELSLFKFDNLDYGPYSEEIIEKMEELEDELIVSHKNYHYEYELLSDLESNFDVERFHNLEEGLSEEKKEILDKIFNTGKSSWDITDLTHEIKEIEEANFGQRVEPHVPAKWESGRAS